MQFPTGADNLEGPVSPDNYKRAVYRQPPSRFWVEMLSPTKQGGSYSYGMRICPIARGKAGDRSSLGSNSSNGSHSEYEVWRRWEDCLWFQETMELEYSRMARDKRQRLLAGKGVKKNGMYIQDQASSFESLPPGPDPNSVARDIHEFIPKLTKKGTLFRASQATIDQRHKELKALVDSLFTEDVPMLIQELRSQRIVTDFFGYWRRDHDLARKKDPSRTAAGKQPRSSVSSSVFSMYFSSSSTNLAADIPPSPTTPIQSTSHLRPPRSPRVPLSRSTSAGASTSSLSSTSHQSTAESTTTITGPYRGAQSPASSVSSSNSSGESKTSPKKSPVPLIVSEDVAIGFGHNPQLDSVRNYHFNNDRVTTGLEPLPEDRELPTKLDPTITAALRTRRKTSAGEQTNRNGQIFPTPPQSPVSYEISELPFTEDPPSTFTSNPVRESWQTTSSVATSILDGLNLTLTNTEFPPPRSRESMASIATFMTDSSADAIFPRTIQSGSSSRTGLRRSMSAGSRRFRRLSLTEEEFSDDDGFIDSYLYEEEPILSATPVPGPDNESRPETPLGHFYSNSGSKSSEHLTSFFAPRSRASTLASLSTSTSYSSSDYDYSQKPFLGHTLTIKAAHNNSIIVLRVPRNISFDDIRQRLYDKFVGQEGVPLSTSFSIAFLLPTTQPPLTTSSGSGKGRSRSSSLSSIGSSVGIADLTQMRFLPSQEDWEYVTSSTDNGKLTLRVVDTS